MDRQASILQAGGDILNDGCAAFEGRPQSVGEEIANSVSHGIGFLAALAAIPFLIVHSVRRGDAGMLVGASVFGTTMAMLYLASTLYHALPQGKSKQVFRFLEHAAIFLLIAGTYTPFTLGVLRGTLGWTLFGLIWTLAVIGVVFKRIAGAKHPIFSTALYLAMGWLVLVAIRPLWQRMPLAGFVWLALGGIAYTVGVIFYALDHRMRYSHFTWHLFVLAGSTFHFFAVLWYAA